VPPKVKEALSADVHRVAARVQAARRVVSGRRSVLVAVSGIDGCGKGYLTERFVEALRVDGTRTAVIHVDGWLNLPQARFSATNPAEHFYRHAVRFNEMFERLVLPLRERRSVTLNADTTEERAVSYRAHLYDFRDVDVILLEGIFLLRPELMPYYDVAIWIRCGFETALERAVKRAQEGLSPRDTVDAYRRIYFPAQEIHFRRDDPTAAATLIVDNDPRIPRVGLP